MKPKIKQSYTACTCFCKMAARDFGPAEFGETKYGTRMVVYDGRENPGRRFEFSYWSKDKPEVTEYFGCIASRVIKEKDKKDGDDLWKAMPKLLFVKITVTFGMCTGRIVNSNPDNPTNGVHFMGQAGAYGCSRFITHNSSIC
jgi:hypothetical protein